MTHTEFIGIIKLLTGEQIIGKIIVCDGEDGFIIENPFTVCETIIGTPHGEMLKVDLRPWAKFAKEELLFIEKEKVITVYESDNRMSQIYKNTLKKYVNSPKETDNRVDLTEEMGFKTKVTDARSHLEKIFKDS